MRAPCDRAVKLSPSHALLTANLQSGFTHVHVGSSQANLLIGTTKGFTLHKKRVSHDWFGTPTSPLFHCLGTPTYPQILTGKVQPFLDYHLPVSSLPRTGATL